MTYNSPQNSNDPLNQPPTGYQDPSQFGQPPYNGGPSWSPARQGLGGGLSRILLTILLGPGALRGRGRGRHFLYARIAFWLIIIGICLYVGFTKHTWVITCTGNDCGD